MLLVGSDDGVYHALGLGEANLTETEKVLDSGRVMRLRQFEKINGVFAATRTGLYQLHDGTEWTNADVPQQKVYSVGTTGSSNYLYAGTRPAHIFAAELTDTADLVWDELDGFQELPSRDEWRLPRHDNLAQVRDLHADPGVPDRLVAGVEVGGVHLSNDGGESWAERSESVDDDIHELHVVGSEEYVAATGHGLYRTTDAGKAWERLDQAVPQSYFRSVFSIKGTIYASGALSNSSTWDDDDADPALFRYQDESLNSIDISQEGETVTGMTEVGDNLVVATHRGNLYAESVERWSNIGTFPVVGELTGRYTPITSYDS